MNAVVKPLPRSVHSDHLKLMREREPWDVPIRLLADEDLDPLQDIASEDFVLAYMLDHPGRVTSLDCSDFTGRDRPVIYQALREKLELELLDKLDERLDCPGYINQLRWQLSHVGLKPPMIRECVANVRRLGALRKLAESMDAIRRKMATMTEQTARSEMARLCFGRKGK